MESTLETGGMKGRIQTKPWDEVRSKIYTPLEVAKEEIWRRWRDQDLRRRVETLLDGRIPPIFRESPKAVLARNIVSPNYEWFAFLEEAAKVGLEPWCLEYTRDIFTSENIDKYYLGKLCFEHGKGKRGGEKMTVRKIIDFDLAEQKLCSDIITLHGEKLVSFHQRIATAAMSAGALRVYDASGWVKWMGGKAETFYVSYLALFICFGVLFENYFLKEEEFLGKNVFASLKLLSREFGIQPLIVPIVPFEDELKFHWRHYPDFVQPLVKL